MTLDFIFFVKRVKNIISTTNINNDTSFETLNKLYKEFVCTFNSDFVIYDEQSQYIYGNSFFETITVNSQIKLFSNNDSIFNIDFFKYFDKNLPLKKCCIIPLYYNNKKSIALVYRNENDFNDQEAMVLEMFFTIIELYFKSYYNNITNTVNNNTIAIKKAISSLSYSELEAMYYVFNSFEGEEIILVASKLASEKKVSRSVIVSGLKKLSAAKAIYCHSMGNKGTYIKILYKYLRKDLK